MKITKNKPAPVVQPPPTYTLELDEGELQDIRNALSVATTTLPRHTDARTRLVNLFTALI